MGKLPGETQAKLGLLGSVLIFGTIGIFVRYLPLSSGVIALVRGVVGTAFLLLMVKMRHMRIAWPDVRRNLVKLCVSGACIGFNWILLFEAYRYTTVATATLCYYFAPIFVLLLSPLVLRERLTPVRCVCIVAALLGMALVSGVLRPGAAGGSLTGVLLGLGAAALYACVVLLNKKLTGIAALDTTIVQLAASALVLLPYVLLTERAVSLSLAPKTLLLLLTVGILHTGVAYALYFSSIKRLPAQTVALFSYIDPIVAILLSALLLQEKMDAFSVAGAALVLGSTLISELADTRLHGARDA